jgi:hypothetical protein
MLRGRTMFEGVTWNEYRNTGGELPAIHYLQHQTIPSRRLTDLMKLRTLIEH